MRRKTLGWMLLVSAGLVSVAQAGTFKAAAAKSAVTGRYVVVLRDHAAKLSLDEGRADLPNVSAVAESLSRRYGFTVVKVWDRALRGFILDGTEEVAQALARNRQVESVEQDALGASKQQSAPVGNCYGYDSYPYGSLFYRTPPAASPQTISCPESNPALDLGGAGQPPVCTDNWGLDRIDQHAAQLDGLYTFDRTGSVPGQVNVRIFFLDTGINAAHREFLNQAGTASRASAILFSADLSINTACHNPDPPTHDPYGHGTHTASIAAGRTFGVAKDASVVMLGVETRCDNGLILDPYSSVVDALNYVAGQRPGVLNWSGGNDQQILASSAIRSALQGVANSGVLVIQAAGNQSSPYPQPGYSPATYPSGVYNACDWTFSGISGLMVVGGVDQHNNRWTRTWSGDVPSAHCVSNPNGAPPDCGSNIGACISLWAPAADILGASRYDTYGYCRLSGTSMAAPHAAGVAALYLQAHPLALPAEVQAALVASATTGLLNTNTSTPNHIGPGSPNRILYSRVP
ncbi:MAG: hypothetical protein QOJ16_3011 [Acidobacteriota bacterium]|nr:hypothetical protein [Acidobacteriota bacterium]